MGNVKWTDDQQKVIDLRNRNILVSAAAGSGKTAVLVERIITMITEGSHPVDIDRLLIVTFTEAAAGEMRERIGKAIEEKLMEQPDNLHLQKQEALLHSAQITTIHSFCLGVIRNYFNTIDLDPSFRIGDETELKLLKSDVLAELLEERYEEGNENFYHFIETYATGKSDNGIEDMILNFHNFAMSYPWPKQWMEQQRQTFCVDTFEDMEGSQWMKLLMEDISRQIESFCEEYKQLIGITEESDGPYMYAEVMEREKAALNKLLRAVKHDKMVVSNEAAKDNGALSENAALGYRALGQQLDIFKWERLSSKKDDSVNADKREFVKDKRDQIKKELSKIKERYFYQSPEEMAADMTNVSEVMNVLIDLAIEFTDRYQEKKEERGIIDFNDLEHFALQILVKPANNSTGYVPTAVAKELQDVYAEILIDEYQDSNYVQEAILTSISKIERGEPNIFMVGDVKQSIYKFRLARPELFMGKYETYSTEDSQYQRIDLHKNFRSRAVVLEGINYIFEGIMRKELGNIEYNNDARLNPGAGIMPFQKSLEMENLEKKIADTQDTEEKKSLEEEIDIVRQRLVAEDEKQQFLKNELILVENNGEDKNLTAQELEARAIAKRMKEYVSGGIKVWDKHKKAYRNAAYSDMVILLRSPKSWTDKMTEVLKEEGIPAVANVQTGYFSALEVRTILNYLLVIDNPLQDIPLTGTLSSFIGNFTEKELGQIREGASGETVYESLKRFVEENAANTQMGEREYMAKPQQLREERQLLAEKIQVFLEQLQYFRQLVPYTSVYDIIQQIYEKTGFYDYVTVLPGGSVRKGNLDMLLQKAIDFEATSYGGLFHFNRYIEKLHEYDIDFGEAKSSDGSDDVVQLMSIHKSKGLEFPIVFLAGMSKNFNQQDSRSRLVLHPDLGIGPDYVDYKLRTKTPTLLKKVIQRQLELENLGEELRVLYVALTRAKEKLVMVGSGKELEKLMDKWQADNVMSYRKLAQAGSYMDWVGPRVMRQIQETGVERCEPTIAEENNCVGEDNKQELYSFALFTVEDLVTEEVLEVLDKESRKAELLSWAEHHPLSEEEKEQIASYMNFVYKYKNDEKIKSKLSVSELKKLYQKEEEDLSVSLLESSKSLKEVKVEEETEDLEKNNEQIQTVGYIPDFAREEEIITGAGRGTIYHKVMECLVFSKVTDKSSIKQQLDDMEEKETLLPEERKLVDMRKLIGFFDSELGKRMVEADKKSSLHKEQPFVMGIPAKEIDDTIVSEELVLVQGIIDAYFEEGSELVLMDYKTDRVSKAGELVDKYKAQLDYYQKALEQITGKKVKEKKIYSFYLGEEIRI